MSLSGLMGEMREELLRCRERITELETEIARLRSAIDDDDPHGDLVQRIQNFARTAAKQLEMDRLREAFDAGANAMLDRLEGVSLVRIVTKEVILHHRLMINREETYLEGRP